jgi:8-oxo-dGTP diphosphatase
MSHIKNLSDQELAIELKRFIENAPKIYLPSVSIDTVIFSFHDDQLKVLLLRFGDTRYFMLPGGYIEKHENLDDAALRILKERTGMENIYLEQFYTSGNNARNKEGILLETLKELAGDLPPDNWYEQRFISVCYYALVDETKVNPKQDPFFLEYKWFDINKLPKLLFDHNLIIEKALSRLQADLDQKLVGFNLLNETFTMGELQKLYEAVYQKQLDRTSFHRKMLSLNVLERLEKQYNGKSHKAPFLYRFIESK